MVRRVEEADDDVVCLFEGGVPVAVQEEGREQAMEELTLCVMAGGTFPSLETVNTQPQQQLKQRDTSTMRRQVHLRITSPNNPYLLLTATIFEEDFPQFRDKNGLRFDFVSFPSVLVNLLQERASIETTASASDRVLSRGCKLHLGNDHRFSFCESDKYRDSEVLGIALVKEGDCGQKQFLAAQVRRISAQLSGTETELGALRVEHDGKMASLEGAVASLRHERDTLETDLVKCKSDFLCEAERRERELLTHHQERLTRAADLSSQEHSSLRLRFDDEAAALSQRTQEVAELKTDLSAARMRIKDLDDQMIQSAAEARRKATLISTLETERTDLETKLQDTHKELQTKVISLVQSQSQNESLTATLAIERERNTANAQSLEDKQLELARAWSQEDTVRKQYEEMKTQFTKSQHIIKQLLAKQQDLKALRDTLQKTSTNSNEKAKSLEEKQRSLEADLQRAHAKAAEDERQIRGLTEDGEKLRKELNEANTCIEYHSRNRGFQGAYSGGVREVVRAPLPTPLKSGVASTPPRAEGAEPVHTASPSHVYTPTMRETASLHNTEKVSSSPTPASSLARFPRPAPAVDAHTNASANPRSTILTASPSHTQSLVMSLAKASAAGGRVPQAPHTNTPSNFFVSAVAGPVGSTA